MGSTSLWKNRRLAARAIAVAERRKGESPAFAGCADWLIPSARSYMEAYDELARYTETWRRDDRRAAVFDLLATMRSWQPLIARDVPGFESRDYGYAPGMAEDAIEDATRLYDLVTDHTPPLAYAPECASALDEKLRSATRAHDDAQVADKQYRAFVTRLRGAAASFDWDLQAFRRTLAVAVGRQHGDHQKLREQRAWMLDPDDDPRAPAPPQAVEPAAEGTTAPVSPS